MDRPNEILGKLYGAIIDNMSINTLKKSISFELIIHEDIKKLIIH